MCQRSFKVSILPSKSSVNVNALHRRHQLRSARLIIADSTDPAVSSYCYTLCKDGEPCARVQDAVRVS